MKKNIPYLLSLLGFSLAACNIACEYGTPVATFELKGKVADTLDNPIENIEINVQQENHYSLGKVYSDETGNFYLLSAINPIDGAVVTIKVEDIDGEENGGEFETQIITFPIKKSDFATDKKRDSWDEGKASKEINFKLIKK